MKIIKFEKSLNPDDKVLAKVQIEKSEKMRLWFLIFKSEKGGYFVRPPSQKIGSEWTPVFELTDNEQHKKLCYDVLKLINEGKYLEQ